jgi:hypothetical protein
VLLDFDSVGVILFRPYQTCIYVIIRHKNFCRILFLYIAMGNDLCLPGPILLPVQPEPQLNACKSCRELSMNYVQTLNCNFGYFAMFFVGSCEKKATF